MGRQLTGGREHNPACASSLIDNTHGEVLGSRGVASFLVKSAQQQMQRFLQSRKGFTPRLQSLGLCFAKCKELKPTKSGRYCAVFNRKNSKWTFASCSPQIKRKDRRKGLIAPLEGLMSGNDVSVVSSNVLIVLSCSPRDSSFSLDANSDFSSAKQKATSVMLAPKVPLKKAAGTK